MRWTMMLIIIAMAMDCVQGCNVTNSDYNLVVAFDNCYLKRFEDLEGWQDIRILTTETTWIKLMKANQNESVSDMNIYMGTISTLQDNGAVNISVTPVVISNFTGVKAHGVFADGTDGFAIDIPLERNNLLAITSKDKRDVAIVEQMLIEAL